MTTPVIRHPQLFDMIFPNEHGVYIPADPIKRRRPGKSRASFQINLVQIGEVEWVATGDYEYAEGSLGGYPSCVYMVIYRTRFEAVSTVVAWLTKRVTDHVLAPIYQHSKQSLSDGRWMIKELDILLAEEGQDQVAA